MDSAQRWKRPWEDQRAPSPLHRRPPPAAQAQGAHHHSPPPAEHRALPALHDEPASLAPWGFLAPREPAPPPFDLAETHQSQADAPQNNKRRRLLPDQIAQPRPHLSGPPADSAGYLGSGEEHDDAARALLHERGRQHPPPASPSMASARPDAPGFLPIVSSNDEPPCCPPGCSGAACARRRAVIQDIVAEVDALNTGIQRLLLRSDAQPRSHSSGAARLGTDQALALALDVLRSNVAGFRDLSAYPPHQPGEAAADLHPPAAAAELRDVMKRRFDPTRSDELPSFLPRPSSGDRDPSRIIPLPGHHEDFRRSFQGSRDPLSPRHSPPGAPHTSTGSVFTRPPSPTHPHPAPHRMLPSPTSLNIAPPSTIHSLSSPSPSLHPQPSSSAAHTAHLQDLQHQISLKTLALQTLRQEYDALLSKLDRQRTKCAALEKKFEVTDVEINSLTTEKEELDGKVAALEQQVEELREQRDEARKREVQTGEQYRSIVEMASRLQGIAAEEKRAWMKEREGLLKALGIDEAGEGSHRQAQEAGTGRPIGPPASTDLSMSGLDSTRTSLDSGAPHQPPDAASTAANSQVIAALRVEVAQLRSRTQALETAIRAMRDQGVAMEEASQAVAEAGKKMREAAREVVGDT